MKKQISLFAVLALLLGTFLPVSAEDNGLTESARQNTSQPERRQEFLIAFDRTAPSSDIQSLKTRLKQKNQLGKCFQPINICSVTFSTKDGAESYRDPQAVKQIYLNKPMEVQGVYVTDRTGDQHEKPKQIKKLAADKNPSNETLKDAIKMMNRIAKNPGKFRDGTVGVLTSERFGGRGRSLITSGLGTLSKKGVNSVFFSGRPLSETDFKSEMLKPSVFLEKKKYMQFQERVQQINRKSTRWLQNFVGERLKSVGRMQPIPIIVTAFQHGPIPALIMLGLELSGLGFTELGQKIQDLPSLPLPYTGTKNPRASEEGVDEGHLISEGITFVMMAKMKGIKKSESSSWWNPTDLFSGRHTHVSDQFTRHTYFMIATLRNILERRTDQFENASDSNQPEQTKAPEKNGDESAEEPNTMTTTELLKKMLGG